MDALGHTLSLLYLSPVLLSASSQVMSMSFKSRLMMSILWPSLHRAVTIGSECYYVSVVFSDYYCYY